MSQPFACSHCHDGISHSYCVVCGRDYRPLATELMAAIQTAMAADGAFSAALAAAGFKRWIWPRGTNIAVQAAYEAKVSADAAMGAVFEQQRAACRIAREG